MAVQTINAQNQVNNWIETEWLEWSRGNAFKRIMGSGVNAPIQVGESLDGKATGGVQVTRSLVLRSNGAAILDDNQLLGNEPTLSDYGHTVTMHQYRTAFIIGKYERRKANFDYLESMRIQARVWGLELTRDMIIAALISPVVDGVTTYDAASVAQRNAWSVAQNPATSNERLLYGAAKANWSGVHATDLTNVDGTADDLSPNIVRLARRLAQNCVPKIRPAVPTTGGNAGKEQFYMPCGSLPFRDLEANMDTIFQQADVRGDDNHIFSNGDIRVGNVTVFEVPEMDYTTSNNGSLITGAGAGGIDVEPAPLLGAQAVIYEIGERMHPITDKIDYDNKQGTGVAQTVAVEKATFNNIQTGAVTAYVSAVAD